MNMKKLLAVLLSLCLLMACVSAEAADTVIVLGETITVDGAPITEDAAAPVHLALVNEKHGDVPEDLKDLNNRVVTITEGGVYRISGTATDCQIAVRAGEGDDVRLILDGVDITCRTAPGIAVYSARDPKTPGEYAVCIELAEGSVNQVTGSHTKRIEETDIKLDGAVDSLVSIGFEGSGQLTVDADNEGIECKYGHMTFNGGVFDIQSGDDPVNVSEDGVGVLTVNGGYIFSAVKNLRGGEGDGIDSNGWIVFNGGTIINLAHPTSMDSGIDSDMGSTINGGVVVGAGNMYDPIEAEGSKQLFMMLEFTESTDDVVVVTDRDGKPVFAYDFPYNYQYIAFSTPDLAEGAIYHVYLGGEVTGEVRNGLYTNITAYTPGRQMQHGGGTAGFGGMTPPDDFGASEGGQAPADGFGASEGGQAPEGFEPSGGGQAPADGFGPSEGGQAPEGFEPSDGSSGAPAEGEDGFGASPGGPRTLENSAEVATTDFLLTWETTGYTNITEVPAE